jgi:chromate transporter
MPKPSLWTLLKVFSKLGATGFGGPLAHIALMDHEIVGRRQWLTRERFLHLHALTQLIPGPNSTELAMIIGRELRGGLGLVIATCGFVLPAVISSVALAFAYKMMGHLPLGQDILLCVRPLILVIIIRALWGFARQLPARELWIIGALAALGKILRLPDLLLLFGGGFGLLTFRKIQGRHAAWFWVSAPSGFVGKAWMDTGTPTELFCVFVKIGAILFGSGYTLLLYLQDDLVHRLGWLTESQVLDAMTVGQMTPGPLFSTASFIGYVLQGWTGAGLATLGIFAPAFLMIVFSGYLLPRLERRPEVPSILLGVNAAAMGLMVHVCFDLAKATLVNPFSFVLSCLAYILLEKAKLDAGLLIVTGVFIGCVWYFF